MLLKKSKKIILLVCLVLFISFMISKVALVFARNYGNHKYIKYVEFNVSYEALCYAYEMDIKTYGTKIHLSWIDLLAYAAATSGGEFHSDAVEKISNFGKKLQKGESIETLTKNLKYFSYYQEAYGAVLGGMLDCYQKKDQDGKIQKYYGLVAYSPIAKGFAYSDYDDFGVRRTYGYSRGHMGHDMIGLVGTPIIAVESGTVEALGWNQYGGWRIGIRTDDKKRYYYYAHLRQNRPYAKKLKQGDRVRAGDVIGYMGHTGYSSKENVNNIDQTHLHFGLELVFDEKQKESNNEIWIDCYALTRFLGKNRSPVVRDEKTKEWTRKIDEF